MIHEFIVGKFISVIKGQETPEQVIQESKERMGKWYKNRVGDWNRIISVEENKEDILRSVIKIETWDNTEFNPVHSEAYSSLMIEIANLKIKSNERNINVYNKNKIISK